MSIQYSPEKRGHHQAPAFTTALIACMNTQAAEPRQKGGKS